MAPFDEPIAALDAASLRNLGVCGCHTCLCPGTILEDQGSGADGTAITGRLPDVVDCGTAWSEQAGSLQIQGGKIECQTTGLNRCVIDGLVPGTAANPVLVEADFVFGSVTAPENSSIAIVFRWQDSSNFWLANVTNGVGDATRNHVELIEVNGGSAFVRANNTSGTFNYSTTYPGSLTLDGDVMTFVINSITITWTSSFLNDKTNYGMHIFQNVPSTKHRFDNFKVSCA